jgi:hypothetical protein
MPSVTGTEEKNMDHLLRVPRNLLRSGLRPGIILPPILLLLMVARVAGGGDVADVGSAPPRTAVEVSGQTPAERVAQLEQQLAALQERIKTYERVMQAQAEIIRQLRARIAELEADSGEREAASPPPPPPRPPATWFTPLSVFASTTEEPLRSELEAARDVTVIPIFYHIHMDPHDTGSIDVERFRRFIPQLIPDPGYNGPVCLDLEGPYTKGLEAKAGSAQWRRAVGQMALAADVLREMRPNVKISYWGVPHVWPFANEAGNRKSWPECSKARRQWKIDEWTAAAKPLLDRIDWFTPSLYDHYPAEYTPEEHALCDGAAAFFVQVCRAMKPEAPVLFSVSPRAHNMGQKWCDELLPEAEFVNDQLRPGLQHGDGIVWWGADRWAYGQGKLPSDEIRPGLPWQTAWTTHFLPLHRHICQVLRRTLAAVQHSRHRD